MDIDLKRENTAYGLLQVNGFLQEWGFFADSRTNIMFSGIFKW
jgi:hypothetical protein